MILVFTRGVNSHKSSKQNVSTVYYFMLHNFFCLAKSTWVFNLSKCKDKVHVSSFVAFFTLQVTSLKVLFQANSNRIHQNQTTANRMNLWMKDMGVQYGIFFVERMFPS